MKNKTIVYVDMDFTLCDYGAAHAEYSRDHPEARWPQSVPGFYEGMAPLPHAIATWHWLNGQPDLDVWILTAPSLKNAHSYTEKRLWVERCLGFEAVGRLIISPNKGLNRGHFLIDDNKSGKGQEHFEGQVLHFGSELFPDWRSIQTHFQNRARHKR